MDPDQPDEMNPDEALQAFAAVYPHLKDITEGQFIQNTDVPEVTRRAINLAISPASGFIWTGEQLRAWLSYKMDQKLKFTPPERIVVPDPSVAGPLIEALRFAVHREELREMYAQLLATSMDSETAKYGHPAFVEIIRQITPDEAKIIKHMMYRPVVAVIDLEAEKLISWATPPQSIETQIAGEPITILAFGTDGPIDQTLTRSRRNISLLSELAGCEHKELVPNYIDNLVRVGIVEKPNLRLFSEGDGVYNTIRKHRELDKWQQEEQARTGQTYIETKRLIRLSELGYQFTKACISTD